MTTPDTPRSLEILFLDVGQGDASLIFPPKGEGDPILFDCNDSNVVLKTLAAHQKDRLQAVVVSHLDADHIGGIVDVLKRVPRGVGQVFVSDDRPLHDGTARLEETAKEVIDTVREGVGTRDWESTWAARDGRPVAAGQDWSVSLIAPWHADFLRRMRTAEFDHPNEYSAILRVCFAGHVVLIGGDAPLVTWEKLPDAERQASVFRIPHHGGAIDDGGVSNGFGVAQLYQSVGAEVAVVSVGTRNRWEHPNPTWIAPIAGGACRMMCTQVTPACHADLATEGASGYLAQVLRSGHLCEPPWRHYQDARRAGGPIQRHTKPRREEVPCAGTVVVSLAAGTPPELRPVAVQHGGWIDTMKSPLCAKPRPVATVPDAGALVPVPT